MVIISIVLWIVALWLVASFAFGIRKNTWCGLGVTKQTANTAMLFSAQIAVIGVLGLNPINFLWMLPLAYGLGSMSLVFPFSLLSPLGNAYSSLCCIGLDKKVIKQNSNRLNYAKGLLAAGKSQDESTRLATEKYPGNSNGEDEYTDQREVVNELMQQQKFSDALPIIMGMLKSHSEDWQINYMAGQCYRFLNNIPDAVRLLTKSASLNPSEATILLALGIALQLAEEYELSIEKLEQAVRLDRSLIPAHNSLGLTYRKLGKIDEAVSCYCEAEEELCKAINKEVLKDLEKCYRDEIVDGKSVRYVLPYVVTRTKELLRADPTYAIILNNIGVCFMEAGVMDTAREQFVKSIEFIPDGYHYPDPARNLESIG
jgi:tetratricopeptide (TPR) repeat protein